MHTREILYISYSITFYIFGHSCGHLQEDNTKDKKLNDDTIIVVTKAI
jgi:hypothetical protein